MREVSIGPKPLAWVVLIAAIVLGFMLYTLGPDPLASAEAGGRPDKVLAIIKWGGMILAVIGLWRLFSLKRVTAGPDGLVIGTLLKKQRHDWSELTGANLDTVEGSPPGYRLRFGKQSMFLLRREYSADAIARLREVVKAHQG